MHTFFKKKQNENSDVKDNNDNFEGVLNVRVVDDYTSIYYDELAQLDYTLDDVIALNKVTGFNCKFGIVDNIIVALIGVVNSDTSIKSVLFRNEDFMSVHPFEEVNGEEVSDERFVVYSFVPSLEMRVALNNTINKIKNERVSTLKRDIQ